ncbi:MAG: M20/M25/M40 family metallo-hydrolase [Acidobacteriota bacterium]
MKLRFKKSILVLSTFILIFCLATSSAFSDVDGKKALKYVKHLASDKFEGRKSGQKGAEKAADWIAKQFEKWGIERAGEKNSYFQFFTIEYFNVDKNVKMVLNNGFEKREFIYGEDWHITKFSGSGRFKSKLIFVGFGISSPENKFDEYRDIDPKGKLVLVVYGIPKGKEKELKDFENVNKKIETAQKKGAKGVIFLKNPEQQTQFFRVSVKKELYRKNFFIGSLEDNATNFIFKYIKYDLRDLVALISENFKPYSFDTRVKIEVSGKSTFDKGRKTKNVLGKISGIDPKLKSEYVIVGAHMDHLGKSPLGDIYNGANDNASGTAVCMEIAREMKQAGIKPKRTVIFALWAAEEQGLLGSKYYTEHPLFPMEKTVAYFNMDMVGHGTGKVNFRGEYYSPEVWNLIEKSLPKEILDYAVSGRGGPGGSDQTYFIMKGIPAYAIMTDGRHYKYHKPRDEWDIIDPVILEKTGKLVYNATLVVANHDENLIKTKREERYIVKYSPLLNINPIEKREYDKIAIKKEFDVDLQFITPFYIDYGEDMKIETILKQVVSLSQEIKEMKKVSLIKSSSDLITNPRGNKLTFILGLTDTKPFVEDMEWARIFGKVGMDYIFFEGKPPFFLEESISEKGKKLLKIFNEEGILIIGTKQIISQMKSLVESSSKPGIILTDENLDKDFLRLIKEKGWAVGISIGFDIPANIAFHRIDNIKKEIGIDNILIFSKYSSCDDYLKSLLDLTLIMLENKYTRDDIGKILGGNFREIFRKVKGEREVAPLYVRPF